MTNQTIIIASFVILFATFFLFFLYQYDRFDGNSSKSNSYTSVSSNNHIDYECQLPSIDPWDDNIRRYLNRYANPLKDCKPKRKILTSLVDGILTISDRSLLSMINSTVTQFRCLYPIDDYNLRYSNWTTLSLLSKSINATANAIRPNCDIVEVQTKIKNNDSIIYRHLHTQIFVNKTISDLKISTNASIYKPSVLILILDSTSSSEAIRSLSETMQLLTFDYEAVNFRYLNKVGRNSRPNAHALLFGKIR